MRASSIPERRRRKLDEHWGPLWHRRIVRNQTRTPAPRLAMANTNPIQWHVCHSKLSHVVGSPQQDGPPICAYIVPIQQASLTMPALSSTFFAFFPTLLHPLRDERHFALVEISAITTKARS